MKKRSEKQKKGISRRKKIILAIVFVFMIFIVGTLVHTLFFNNTTECKTIDNTKVVENQAYKDIPKDNSTPADYSPAENISICQSVIQNMDAWTSKTEGTAVADVLFMNYTQNISASKVIKDGSATQQSASESSLLSTGQQRTFKDDAILIRNAKKVKSMDDIEWEEDFTPVSKETYAKNYGRTPFALTNYVIDETTIIKSKELDSDKDTYKYEFELKPEASTVYYKRQMKTEGGASDYPTFHSVKVTVTMDRQWRPLVIHYSENYDINIAVVGDVTCQGEITETFSDFGKVKALPDQDFVDDYIKNKYDKNKLSDLPTKEATDVSKYITDMFISQPYYQIKLSIGDTKLDMNMYIDIDHGTVKINNKEFFAAYSNKKVYMKYGDVKVSMKADSVFEAITIIGNAVNFDTKSMDFDYLTKIDFDNISLDDQAVSGLLNDVKLEQSDEAIKVSFVKDDIKADVKVTLKDESVSLDYANISLKLGGSNVSAKIMTANQSEYPKLKGFNDISKVTTLLQPWIDTMDSKGVAAKISMKTSDIKLAGKAVLGYNPLKLKFSTTIDGVKMNAVVVKKTVFIRTGNIKVQCKLSEIERTIKRVMVMVGIDMKKNCLVPKQYAKTINQLKNGNVNIKKLIRSVKSVEFKNGYLNIKGSINKLGFKLAVSKDTIKINQGKKLAVKAKITKKYKNNPKIKMKKSAYVSTNVILKTLSKLSLYKLLKSKGIILDTRISGKGFTLKGVAKAAYDKGFIIKYTTNIEGVPITLIYKKSVIYVKSGKVMIKSSSKYAYSLLKDVLKKTGVKINQKTLLQAKSFEEAFQSLIKEYAGSFTVKDIVGNVKTFQYQKGYLIVQYQYAKGKIVTIKLKKKTFLLSTVVLDMNLNVKLKIQKIYTKSPTISVNSNDYTKLSDIISVLENLGLEELIAATGIDTDVNLNVGEKNIKINVKANYGNDTALLITTDITEGKTTIPVTVKYWKHLFYIDVANIHIKATKKNIESVFSQVLQEQNVSMIFAKDLSTVIREMVDRLSVKDIISNIKSFSCDKESLKVQYQFNNENIDIAVTGKTVTVKGLKLDKDKLDVWAKINNTKEQNISVTNKEQYVDLGEALNLIQVNMNQFNDAKAFGFKANIQLGDYNILADVLYDKANNTCKATIPYQDDIIEAAYVDDVVYLHAGKFYIKATREKLFQLVKKYSGYELDEIFAGKNIKEKLSLALIFNIKNVSMEDGKLVIEYDQDTINLKANIEKTRDEIQISGINVGDMSVNAKVAFEQFFYAPVIDKSDYNNNEKYLDLNKILEMIDFDKIKEGIQVNVTLNINNANITGQLIYVNDNLYFHAGNIYIKTDIQYILSLLQESGVNVDTEISMKDVLDRISEFQCSDNELSFVYNTDTPLVVRISNGTISINDFIQGNIVDTNVTEVEEIEKYIDLSAVIAFVKKWKEQPAVTLHTSIKNKELSVVYENKTIYVAFDGLKIKSDDGSIASIVNAILKIYDVDITPVFEWLGIVEDENNINLDMFRQYAKSDALDNILSEGKVDLEKVLESICVCAEEISYQGKISDADINVKLYDSIATSNKPDTNGYIDVSSIDTLLKSFGDTAANLNFDVRAKASLALSLGLIHMNLEDVPMSAKLKAEKEGVYGTIHADIPCMKKITDNNISVPSTTTETTESTSKTKTEVKTSYSLVSDSEVICTDFFVTPKDIYIHKNIKYQLTKTITTTKYKKILVWIPQSIAKETETVSENKDFYIKRTYKEMQDNVMPDLCFALNMTDGITDKILESSNHTDVTSASLGNIIKSYSFDNAQRFDFGLDLAGLTNGAIADTSVNLYKNSDGYLDNLYAECKLYSLIAIKLDAELNNIGQTVDIGFHPEQLANDEHYK